MLTVDEAFRKFKSRLELNEREQKNAADRHREIREHLRTRFAVENDFLTGSYARYTKTKPLKDIDIFFALGADERHYRDQPPARVLDAFHSALADKYGKAATRQRRSCTVEFGVEIDDEDRTDYSIVSVDVVPAFQEANGDYEIPDAGSGVWMKTNPKIHAEKATAAHKAYDEEWKGLVRMVKYWNYRRGKPIKPSFLIEVMCLECLHGGFGAFDYEVQSLFATMRDRIHDTWADPAGLGPTVSDMMSKPEKDAARKALETAERAATNAIDLARKGKNYEAQKAWRELFGPRFPHP